MNRAKAAKAQVDTLTRLQGAVAAGDRGQAANAALLLRDWGWTWAELGEALGISRQAAHKRWAHLPTAAEPSRHDQ